MAEKGSQTCKVVLIGESDVRKTNIISKYITNAENATISTNEANAANATNSANASNATNSTTNANNATTANGTKTKRFATKL